MTIDDPKQPYAVRLRWIWGVPEVEVAISARDITPPGFRPDTTLAHAVRGTPEGEENHQLLCLSVAQDEVVAFAVAKYGQPDILKFEDLAPSPNPSPILGGPSGVVN